MVLVIATDFDNLKEYLIATYSSITEIENITCGEAYQVQINNKDVLFLKAGCTKVVLTLALHSILKRYNITSIFGIGNTASLHNNVRLNDIAIICSAISYDVNFTALGYPLHFIPSLHTACFDCDESYIKNAITIASTMPNQTCVGKIGSADQFVASNYLSRQICYKCNIDFIDNESATISEIAYIFKIPFLIIKGVSNHAGNNAEIEYSLNKEKSNNNAYNIIVNLLNEITLKEGQ